MSMRGDDVLAFHIGAGAAGLQVLKAEAKSGGKMQAGTVSTARDALSAYGELPSPHAMSFVADRLEAAVDKPLRDMLDDAQLKRNLKPAHVTHMLFTFSGNDTTAMLSKNLASYVGGSSSLSQLLQTPMTMAAAACSLPARCSCVSSLSRR